VSSVEGAKSREVERGERMKEEDQFRPSHRAKRASWRASGCMTHLVSSSSGAEEGTRTSSSVFDSCGSNEEVE